MLTVKEKPFQFGDRTLYFFSKCIENLSETNFQKYYNLYKF